MDISSAYNPISSNTSLFFSIGSPRTPHFVSIANGSNDVYHEVSQVPLSLRQLTKSLNCSVPLMPIILLYMSTIRIKFLCHVLYPCLLNFCIIDWVIHIYQILKKNCS